MTDRASDHGGVLVVGAGPVGLVLAADLVRQGVPVRIVDSAPGDSPHSRAIVMGPRTLELLRRLDVVDRLDERGLRLDAVSFYSDGRRLGAVAIRGLPDTPYPFALTIPQASTERVLRERFGELGGTVERQVRLTGLDNTGPRPVATLAHPDGFLAGDAAHVFSAAGAQGMNTGIQDAVNLSWRLGGVIRGALDPGVLDGYPAERRPAVQRVSVNTQRQTEWGLLDTWTKITARNHSSSGDREQREDLALPLRARY